MIQKEIEIRLSESAMGYFEIGINHFHNVRHVNWESFQPSLGNLCVSIELMLKALIANKCFNFLYSNLPLELEIKLCYNEKKLYKITKIEELGLLNFTYYTQEIDKCISIFYALFPQKKHEFKPFFNLFSAIRNVSVHGAFPKFQKYDLERIAFLSLNLYQILKSENFYKFSNHKLNAKEERFLNEYNHIRNERVKKVVEEAKNNSKKFESTASVILYDNWDLYVTKCPICSSDGILVGSTEYSNEQVSDSDFEGTYESLDFRADSFKCEGCELELLDYTELVLAGMEVSYDRTNEIEKWLKESLK